MNLKNEVIIKHNNLIYTILGVILSIRLTFIGQIYLLEIVSVIYFFINLRSLEYFKFFKTFIFLLFLHQITVIFSDLYNQTEINNFIKGFLNFPILLICILFLYNFFKNKFSLYIFFLLGFYFGDNVLNNFITSYNIFFFDNIWKWGLGFYLISSYFLYYELKNKKISKFNTIFFSSIIMLILLINGARALPLVIFYSLILFIFFSNTEKLKIFGLKKLFFVFSLIIFSTTLIIGFLPSKINSIDYFTKVMKKNYEQQGDYGVVVSARSEWISMYHAFKDRPYIGHGSYPKDNNFYYTNKIGQFLYQYNYIDNIPNYEILYNYLGLDSYKQIPTHSFFGYHLISYGVFGVILITYILFIFSKFFFSNYTQLSFFYYFQFINFVYNFYFSPWGASHRIYIELFIVILVLKSIKLSAK